MCGEHWTHPSHTGNLLARAHWPGPRSPAEVREAVRDAFQGARRARRRDAVSAVSAVDDDAVGDALLVASELTTNAMLHGGGVTGFEVTLDDREVRLSVSDRSREVPRRTRRGPGADERGFMRAGGHGWPIICHLARDITISELDAGGKRITAVVPLASPLKGP